MCISLFAGVYSFAQVQGFNQSFSCQYDTTLLIQLGGKLDGQNCQRAHEYIAAGWPDNKRIPAIEPLDSIVLYNGSQKDIHTLQLFSSGNHIYSMDSLSKQVCTNTSQVTEDSIYDVYRYVADHNYYFFVPEIESREFKEVTRHFGVYGYGHCGSIGNCATLIGTKLFGPSQRLWYIDGENHGISELFLNGRYYYVDADEEMLVKDRHNKRYLSLGEVYEDLFLFYRTKSLGKGVPYSFGNSILYSTGRYFNNTQHYYTSSSYPSLNPCYANDTTGNYGPDLGFTLKAGERMKWAFIQDSSMRFHHYPRFYCSNANYGYLPDSSNVFPVIQNIQTRYDLFDVDQNVQDKFLAFNQLKWLFSQHKITADSSYAELIWNRSSLFPYVGGKLFVEGDFISTGDSIQFQVSFNNQTWQTLGTLHLQNQTAVFALDSFLLPHGSLAKHELYIRAVFYKITGSFGPVLKTFIMDLKEQCSTYLYPSMRLGSNLFEIKIQDTLVNGQLNGNLFWHEHSENDPPIPPQTAIYPPDQSTINKTDVAFTWEPKWVDQEGDSIAEWHFQLSEYPDFHRLLANNFDYLSLHHEGAKPYFLNYFDTVIGTRNTFFNHQTTYYWRVRIRDKRNAWSTWSPAWSFTVKAPKPVRNLRFELISRGTKAMSLVWQKGELDSLTNHYLILNNNNPSSLYPHPVDVLSYQTNTNVYPVGIHPINIAFRVFALDAANNCSPPSSVVTFPYEIGLNTNDILNLTDTVELLQHPFPAYPSLNRSYFLIYDSNYFQPAGSYSVQLKGLCRSMLSIAYEEDMDTIYMRQYIISNTHYSNLLGDCSMENNSAHHSLYPNVPNVNPFASSILDHETHHVRYTPFEEVPYPKYVYNVMGDLLFTTFDKTVDMSAYPAGIYFVRSNGSVQKIRVD